MPRKKKTSAETDSAEPEKAAQTSAPLIIEPVEPGEDLPKPGRKTPAKTAAKKRTGKAATKKAASEVKAAPAEAPGAATAQPAEAVADAQAAETFGDAFEANNLREVHSAPAAAESAPEPEPPAPEASQAYESEAGELKGDEEPGGGDEKEERPEPPPARQERLQKILAAAGVASRRHAEELIVAGRVQVNGQVVTTLGSKADPARDHIRVDGKLLHGAERLRYFVLNKPRGYVTTVSDPEGRPTVMQFFERMGERLYPVGRLDYLSEGLLLMTNDGELANKLTRAASGVEKVYLVKVAGQPGEAQIEALRSGVRIDRGRQGEGQVQTAPARIRQIRQGENPWFEVALIEGRNRELRKMFEEIGHHVEKIRRVGYGPLVLDQEPGKMRELEPEEVQALRLTAEGKLKPKRIKTAVMLPRESGRTVDPEAKRGGRKPFRGEERRERSVRPAAPERRSEPRAEFRPERGFQARPKPGMGRGEGRSEFRPRREQGGFAPRQERREFPPRGNRPPDRGQRGEGAGQRKSGQSQFGGAGRERRPERRGGFEGARRPFRERTGPGAGPARPAFRPGAKPGFKLAERPSRPEPATGEGREFERPSARRFERPAERPPRENRGETGRSGPARGGQERGGPARSGPFKVGPGRFSGRPGREGRPAPGGRGGSSGGGRGPRPGSGPGRGGPGRGGPGRGGKPGSFGKR